MSVQEKIHVERINFDLKKNDSSYDINWRITIRPILASLWAGWEMLYLDNGGILSFDKINIGLTKDVPIFQFIIPLYWSAKIKEVVNIFHIINKARLMDWIIMNNVME